MSLENKLNKLIILNVRRLPKGFRWKCAEIQLIPEDNLIQILQCCISLYLICIFFKQSSLETESLEYYRLLFILSYKKYESRKDKDLSAFYLLLWISEHADVAHLQHRAMWSQWPRPAQDQGLKGRRDAKSENEKHLKWEKKKNRKIPFQNK